jgi:UDP-N-acetylmuramoylalanine--D-glutamate ligase
VRILGKGKTAQAINKLYPNAVMYEEKDIEQYNSNSEELTIVSPGIPPSSQLVQNTKNLISEYDLFSDVMPYNIWISGTNGKTTTTQMLQSLLEEKGSICGGNIGMPLANMNTKVNIWILETSSFTLHYTTKAKPNLYILLPISEDHISWHGTFAEYEKSKLKPLEKLEEGEIAIIPSKYKDYPTNGYKICYDNNKDLANYFNIQINSISFKDPFLMDALLALSVTKILFDEVDYKKINSFKQDIHKIEEFQDIKNRIWIDDSKATNIDATIQALKSYNHKKIFLILGGDDKGANMKPLFKELQQYDIELFLIGANRKKLHNLSNQYNIANTEVVYLEKAVNMISQNSRFKIQNCVAILSPAAASFDQFQSYKHRGEEFKRIVYTLS